MNESERIHDRIVSLKANIKLYKKEKLELEEAIKKEKLENISVDDLISAIEAEEHELKRYLKKANAILDGVEE